MKKIGVLSDTHGYLDPKIFYYFEQCDEIWHAGDIGSIDVIKEIEKKKLLKAVYGNIDGKEIRALVPEEQLFICEGLKIWMVHIAGRPPKYTPYVKKKLAEVKPDVLVCGHSHILTVKSDPNFSNMLYINPGAAGKHGFHKVKTLIRFNIDNSRITAMEAIELGKRA